MNEGWVAAAVVLFFAAFISGFVGAVGLLTQLLDDAPVRVPASLVAAGLALGLLGAVCIGIAS